MNPTLGEDQSAKERALSPSTPACAVTVTPALSTELRTRLIEGSQDCIKLLDLDGRLLAMNTGGMRVLEICDLAPVIGTSWFDFWENADREAAFKAVRTA